MKTIVTVSRKWNNPKIKTTISKEGIELEMDIKDFTRAMKAELTPVIISLLVERRKELTNMVKDNIGSVTWTFTKATFDNQVDKAITAEQDEKCIETMTASFVAQLDEAIQAIIAGIKDESAKVV